MGSLEGEAMGIWEGMGVAVEQEVGRCGVLEEELDIEGQVDSVEIDSALMMMSGVLVVEGLEVHGAMSREQREDEKEVVHENGS